MRAELEFDTPNPRVILRFPGFTCEGIQPGEVMSIGNLPFAFAKELQKRWNAYAEEQRNEL